MTRLILALAVFALPATVFAQGQGTTQTNAPDFSAMILTPKPPPTPRINGPKVFGVRPGNPFMFTIPATGNRPMTYAVDNLPEGLKVDPNTGIITGKLTREGDYKVTFRAKNSLGEGTREFKIVCGPLIGLTPALGWNSWNVFGRNISDELARTAADAMVKDTPYGRLIDHGYSYVNLDDGWERAPAGRTNDALFEGPARDPVTKKFLTNKKFPDMKALGDYIHSKGLKYGIYSGPGTTTCQGLEASYQHELIDAQTWAEWGVDYLKYDWCGYSQVANRETAARIPAALVPPPPTNTAGTNATRGRRGGGGAGRGNYLREDYVKPYRLMGDVLNTIPRDIIYSLCQYGWDNVWEWGAAVGGNSWRTTGDITDTWQSLSSIGFRQGGHEKFVGPGRFDDPDMLILGKVGWGRNMRATRLTADEQYTHISLWCLLSSPMLIGCDMAQMDDFTISLLCNDEVLDVNQDSLGRQASRLSQEGPTATALEVWAKQLEDGSMAVGLFNRSDENAPVTAKWADLRLTGKQTVRDLWRQKDLGSFETSFQAEVPRHGVVFVKITPAK